jgi:hypothetical protein
VGKDDGSITGALGDGPKGHVARYLHRQFVVLLKQQGAYETDGSAFIGEDVDDLSVALDLGVQALGRICRMQLGAVLGQ